MTLQNPFTSYCGIYNCLTNQETLPFEVSDFSMQSTIQAGTRKTVTNALKTIRKNVDASLKCFCGGFETSDYRYPNIFFSALTMEYICYGKSGSFKNNSYIKFTLDLFRSKEIVIINKYPYYQIRVNISLII